MAVVVVDAVARVDVLAFETFALLAWAFVEALEASLVVDSWRIGEASCSSHCSRRHCRTSPD